MVTVTDVKVFIKHEAKVVSRVSSVKKRVVYFSKLLFKSNEKKFSLGRVES